MTTADERVKQKKALWQENAELRIRLAEADETLRAIRNGEVDAVVVTGDKGEQIFSLVGSDSIYRLLVETMKEAAFTLTIDGQILFCNAQLGELVKCPMENIVGHRLDEFIAESGRTEVSTFLLAAQQQPVKQRLVFQTCDGTPVPAHVASNVLNQPDGLSICVVANDLNELENSTELIQQLRRQQVALKAVNEELAATEEELRVQNEELAVSRDELDRARARYQDLFETAPDGYIVTGPDGTIQDVNRAAAQLLGCPADGLRGNPFSALLPETAKEAYLRNLASLTAGTTSLPGWEVQVLSFKGESLWTAITAAASHDEDGKLAGLRWLIRDITERKRAEKALRESEQRLRSLAENSPGVLQRFDRQFRVMWLSPRAEEATGIPVEQFIGKTNREMGMPADLVDLWEKTMTQVFETAEHREIEFSIETPNGMRTYLLRLAPEFGGNGKQVESILGLSTDITERKEKEKELLKSYKEIESFNTIMVGRELRMIELKKEIDQLYLKCGQPSRYGYGSQAIDTGKKQDR